MVTQCACADVGERTEVVTTLTLKAFLKCLPRGYVMILNCKEGKIKICVCRRQGNKAAWHTFDVRQHNALGVTSPSTCSSVTPKQLAQGSRHRAALPDETSTDSRAGEASWAVRRAGEATTSWVGLPPPKPLDSSDPGIRAGKAPPEPRGRGRRCPDPWRRAWRVARTPST